MADDVFPLCFDEENRETNIGMVYVDDYELYNALLAGQNYVLAPVIKTPHKPPYWLKLIPLADVQMGPFNIPILTMEDNHDQNSVEQTPT